jgi:hypothetical protein
MKKIIYPIAIAVLLLTCLPSIGQDIQFKYDECGNRYSGIRAIKSEKNLTDSTANMISKDKEIFNVYPNPVHEIVYVDRPVNNYEEVNTPIQASLFTEKGELLKSFEISSYHFPINFSGYATGIYILLINTEQGSEKWNLIKY